MAERDIVLELIEQRKGDALRAEAAELDKLADKAEVANRSMSRTSDASSALSKRIEEQTTKVKALASEIERTGGDKGMFRDFAQADRELKQLEKVSAKLKQLIPEAAEVGSKAGSNLMSGVADGASSGSWKLYAALGGIGTLLAPTLGAAIAGVVTGAVGAGGIVGGIAAAAKDPAVAQAGGDLLEEFNAEFAEAGHQFVGPALQSIDTLGTALRRVDLTSVLAPAVPYVDELTSGLAGFAEQFAGGFTRALEDAGPSVAVLAEELPQIGDALGDMLADMAASDGTVEGLAMTLDLLGRTVRGTGDSIAFLSDRFDEQLEMYISIGQAATDFTSWTPAGWLGLDDYFQSNVDSMREWQGAGRSVVVTQEELDNTTGALGGTVISTARGWDASTQAIEANNKALQEQALELNQAISDQLAMDNAALRVEGGWSDLTEAIKDNGHSLDATKEKGIANRLAILQQITTLDQMRREAIDTGDGTKAGMDKANAGFNKALDKLIDLAAKAGLSRRELEKMAKAYYITVTTTYVDKHVNWGKAAALDLPGRAGGGRVMANMPYIVGEHRPELFVPDTDGYIQPRVPTSSSGGAGSGGGGYARLAPLRVDDGTAAAALVQLLQTAAQRQYGGDPVLMLSVQ